VLVQVPPTGTDIGDAIQLFEKRGTCSKSDDGAAEIRIGSTSQSGGGLSGTCVMAARPAVTPRFIAMGNAGGWTGSGTRMNVKYMLRTIMFMY